MDAKDFPNTWRWTGAQIEAAERDPKTPQHIRDELQRMAQAAQAEIDSARDELRRFLQAAQADEPGVLLWRAHQDELESMIKAAPGLADADIPLGEFVEALHAHRSYGARKAAAAGAGKPRASRHAPDHPAWLRAAQQAAARHPDGTSAARKRKITAALVEVAPGIPRRTLAAFVASRWRDFSATTPRR